MQDRPTAIELLDAIGAFLRDRTEHARDRWERFQFQVAANTLSIISRELEFEDGFMREEWVGLDGLLGAEPVPPEQLALVARLLERNEDLARRIAGGHYDGGDDDAVVAHLWATVVNKVRIASPKEAP